MLRLRWKRKGPDRVRPNRGNQSSHALRDEQQEEEGAHRLVNRLSTAPVLRYNTLLHLFRQHATKPARVPGPGGNFAKPEHYLLTANGQPRSVLVDDAIYTTIVTGVFSSP